MKRKDAKLIRRRVALIVRKAIERVGKKKSLIAQETGISSLTLSKILSGHGNPSEETLRALGRVLWNDEQHIQKDKVLQRIKEPKEEKPSTFALNLRRVLEERKITRVEFARQVGVTPTVVSLWLKAGCTKGAFPKDPNMVKITKFLGLSASKLKSPRLFAKEEVSDGGEKVSPENTCPENLVPGQEVLSPEKHSTVPEEESALDWEARCRVLEAEIAQLKRELSGGHVEHDAVASEPLKQSAPTSSAYSTLLRSVVREIVDAILDVVERRKRV